MTRERFTLRAAAALAIGLSLALCAGCAKAKRDKRGPSREQVPPQAPVVSGGEDAPPRDDSTGPDDVQEAWEQAQLAARPHVDRRAAGPLTAEVAKQAIVELVRATPEEWIGNPDPDRLAELPVRQARNDGPYYLGAFQIDLEAETYRARIGDTEDPVSYEYRGQFAPREGGGWEALPPNMWSFRNRPRPGR